MPSIFIPTKTQLTTYTANPQQLVKDAQAEDYFINVDKFEFLTRVSDALRAGLSTISYSTTLVNATNIKNFLSQSDYKFGYADTDFVIVQDQETPTLATLTFTWTYVTE